MTGATPAERVREALDAYRQAVVRATVKGLEADLLEAEGAGPVSRDYARALRAFERACETEADAREALEMGLVNKVVPLAELESETLVWCREILANSPTALRFLKAALNADCDGQAGLQEHRPQVTSQGSSWWRWWRRMSSATWASWGPHHHQARHLLRRGGEQAENGERRGEMQE